MLRRPIGSKDGPHFLVLTIKTTTADFRSSLLVAVELRHAGNLAAAICREVQLPDILMTSVRHLGDHPIG